MKNTIRCNKNIIEAACKITTKTQKIEQVHTRQMQTKVVFNLLICNWQA